VAFFVVLLSGFAESLWVEGAVHGCGNRGVDEDGGKEVLSVF
jgi:hypothetical protein